MAQSLKRKIERLEQQAAAWARQRDEELYGSRSDEELLFFMAHGYFPEAARVCSGEPQTKQVTSGKFRTTITLERLD